MERLGRVGEMQVLGDRDEVPQLPQVHVHAFWLSQQVLDGEDRGRHCGVSEL